MKANYISYFKESNWLGQSMFAHQSDGSERTFDAFEEVKKVAHHKIRQRHASNFKQDNFDQMLQYRLEL